MAYHPKSLRFISVLQIIVGSISLLLGIVSAVLRKDFTSILSFGIWVGVWVIVAGLLGFFGSRDPQVPSRCLLGTFMGFTITACVLAGTMMICYPIVLARLANCIRNWSKHDGYCDVVGETSLSSLKTGIGIGSVLLTIAVLEFVVGLASSIYCCAAICPCCNGTSGVQGTQQVVYLQPAMGQVSAAGGGMVVTSGSPPSTVVQPSAGQFIVQQPREPRKEQEAPPTYDMA